MGERREAEKKKSSDAGRWPIVKPKQNLRVIRLKDTDLFTVQNFFTMAESVAFIKTAETIGFVHQGSLGPTKGEAFRDNDRISVYDSTLADNIWESGLCKLLSDIKIRGKSAVGLNPNIRFYRVRKAFLGSFKTGAILLAGLFIYDMFWVFFTPVMVNVAKSFDAPIKLLFPTAEPYSMLGLGDIVIPGIFVALALRFDVSRGKQSQYFKSASLGYTFGLVLTIFVMNWFQVAQPGLLYIVPEVIGFLAAHCTWNSDVKPSLEFDESKPVPPTLQDDSGKSSSIKKDE